MSRIQRTRRVDSGASGRDMLSFKERKFIRELELTHGVIISASLDMGLVARRWKTDEIVTEADNAQEMAIVLRSMIVYPDPDEMEPVDG